VTGSIGSGLKWDLCFINLDNPEAIVNAVPGAPLPPPRNSRMVGHSEDFMRR
jgi:hypothetical protein